MVDPHQIQLVNALAQQATEAELERNSAKDRLDIALHRSQQPNPYRWRQHGAAWIFASVVGMSGTVYALQKEASYVIPLAAGAGLSAGLLSNAVDKRRQIDAKQDCLEMCRYGLGESEKHLRQTVTSYREEEETGWLMYALNTSKESLLTLRTWMADPRRTMKDAVLESIDIVTTQFLGQPLDDRREERLNSPLTTERQYRKVRGQLFDGEIALQKDEFLANVFAKHHFLREQELQQAGLKADLFMTGTAVGVGSVTGLLAGAGITALSAKAAAMGSSKVAIAAHSFTGAIGITAVVGAGLLAAGTLHNWMSQADHQRRQREAQQFEEAFTATTQILEAVMQAQTTQDLTERRTHLQTAYDCLNVLCRQALKGQDLQMKQYVEILSDRLQRSLKVIAKQQPLSSKFRLNLFSPRS
jgi:transposase-like protein